MRARKVRCYLSLLACRHHRIKPISSSGTRIEAELHGSRRQQAVGQLWVRRGLLVGLDLVTWLGESPSAPIASLPAELVPFLTAPLSAWPEYRLPSLESLARGSSRPPYSRSPACTSSTLCGYPKLSAPTVLASIGPSQQRSEGQLPLRQLGRAVALLREGAPLRPWLYWGGTLVLGPLLLSGYWPFTDIFSWSSLLLWVCAAGVSLRVVRRLRHRWPLHRYFFFIQLASISVATQPWPTLLSLLSAVVGLSSPATSWLLLPTLLLPSPSSLATLLHAGRVAVLCYNSILAKPVAGPADAADGSKSPSFRK